MQSTRLFVHLKFVDFANCSYIIVVAVFDSKQWSILKYEGQFTIKYNLAEMDAA